VRALPPQPVDAVDWASCKRHGPIATGRIPGQHNLIRLLAEVSQPPVTFAAVVDRLGDRAFGEQSRIIIVDYGCALSLIARIVNRLPAARFAFARM
jgi:hypothetical protein